MLNLLIELFLYLKMTSDRKTKRRRREKSATQGRTDGVVEVVVVVVGYLSLGQSLGGAIEVCNNHVFPVNHDR